MGRGPCICIALRQVILELADPLTGQFGMPHPSFSPQRACSGPPGGRVLAGQAATGGDRCEVWEGHAQVTNSRAYSPFAELKELEEDTIPRPNGALFSLPTKQGSLLTGIHCGNVCLSGLDSSFAHPSLPPCHTRSHPTIDFLLHLTVDLEPSTAKLALKLLSITNARRTNLNSLGCGGSAEALISLDAHGVGGPWTCPIHRAELSAMYSVAQQQYTCGENAI